MTRIRKAVITAAGRGTRQYPATNTVQKELFPLVDVDGYAKPTLQIIVEEALASGLEEICIVVNPANAAPIQQHFRGLTEQQAATQFAGKEWAKPLSDRLHDMARRLSFVVQREQEGYGHAVYQARDWVGGEPFALLLGDHVYFSEIAERCTRQVVAAYESFQCPISSVSQVSESVISRYGIVAGTPLAGTSPLLYDITAMTEKPTADFARSHLRTPGLPESEYLSFFGIHVFPPALFDCLEHLIRDGIRQKNEFQLTSAQAMLFERGRYVACEIKGARYDMGIPEGLIETQIALALRSPFAAQARAMLG